MVSERALDILSEINSELCEMEGMTSGGSVTRPPLLDGKNYSYWKSRMIAFLKSLEHKAWKSVLTGWTAPLMPDGTIKMEANWTQAEDDQALGNNTALNAIFNGVTPNVFKLISQCSVAKEAWETLQTTYEGTSQVRMSKLQQLTARWESAKMKEDEDIATYGARITDMANEAFALGEPMTHEKQVRKVLRTLPQRFESKVTAIEESKDLTVMKIDDLLGNLTTHEMKFDSAAPEKKGVALKISHKKSEEELAETMNLLARKFNKTITRYNRKPTENPSGTDNGTDNWRDKRKSEAKRESSGNQNQGRNIRCKECEGFGHIQVQCPNYIRKQAKSYYATHSDDDEPMNENTDNVVAFTSHVHPEGTVITTSSTSDHTACRSNDTEEPSKTRC